MTRNSVLPRNLSREDQGPTHTSGVWGFGRSPGFWADRSTIDRAPTVRPFPDLSYKAQWM